MLQDKILDLGLHKMPLRCEDGRVKEFFSLFDFFKQKIIFISIIFFISPL